MFAIAGLCDSKLTKNLTAEKSKKRSFWAIFDYFLAFRSYIFAEFLEISTKLLLFLWRYVIIRA